MTPPSPTLALTEALIRCPSVTPDDAGCIPLLRRELEAMGFRCELLPVGEVTNLWAEFGSSGPLFVFAGHTDVVPTGPHAQWTYPPFEPAVHDGLLYGRGAADMKGSLAAMVVATRAFLQAEPEPRGRIGFLLTSDEEGRGVDGTRAVMALLAARGVKLDYCIVGEPTSEERLGDIIKHGRRGSLHGTLRVLGKQGHVAYPHLALNPVHQALAALAELTSTVWDQGDEDFAPTSLQISNLQAGTGATNVIPGELNLRFNLRHGPISPSAVLQERIEAILTRHGLRYELDWTVGGEPFITRGGELVDAVVSAVQAATGVTPRCTTGGGTSDARFIAPYGTQVLEFGPINATIHAIDERVAVADLDRLAAVYQGVLERMLRA